MFLGLVFSYFTNQQHANVHIMASSEMAHFLAESGISSTLVALRGDGGTSVKTLLSQPGPLADVSLLPYLPETLNQELARLAKEVDRSASIRVKVGLTGFRQTETDPALWVDPVAKVGWLSIESKGEYRGFQRTLTVRKKVSVGSALPPVVSKFTLHVQDVARDKEGSLNTVRNDLSGNLLNGPRPVICFNHDTPDNSVEPRSVPDPQGAETLPEIGEKRGWIWFGGKKVRLNLMAGATALGELFHFSSASGEGKNVAISFKLSPDLLPPVFSTPLTVYWDLIEIDPMREVRYQLGQGFILQGFYGKTANPGLEAMYDNGVLSYAERKKYGTKSSMFHLFGDARKGFQSRTRVLGNVYAAFPSFSNLEVTPQDPEVLDMFQNQTPAPVFLFPEMSEADFDPTRQVTEFLNRRIGGPILPIQAITESYAEYRKLMSRIVEIPYASTSNFMESTSLGNSPGQSTADEMVPAETNGLNLTLERDHQVIFQGPVGAPNLITVVENRVQKEVTSISEFWEKFYDPDKNLLDLSQIVRIRNSENLDLVLPPRNRPPAMTVSGGGMIILEEGNLILRGVKISSPDDALTVIVKSGTKVLFENALPNQINIAAPKAQISVMDQFHLCGTLAVAGIASQADFPGGIVQYRESQDPTQASSLKFAKIRINEWDSFWHE